MGKMEHNRSFCLQEDQWSSVYLTVQKDGRVLLEADDRKEQQYSKMGDWSWEEFYERHKDSTEKPYREAAALIASLSEEAPK